MRWVLLIVGVLAGAVISFLLMSVGVLDRVDGIPGTQVEPVLSLPTYLSFLGVMLTAVTVVLAALAISIGIVAAYTFRELTDRAREAAEQAVKKALSDDRLDARFQEASLRMSGNKISTDELEEGFDPSDSGER